MKYKKILGVLGTMLIFASCDFSSFDENSENEKPEETTVTEETTLFNVDDESGTYIFETNDTKYLSAKGYTLWTVSDTNDEEEFLPISINICKESGKSEAGFGIVFCVQEIDGKTFMLTVLINVNGLYTVGKITDGDFSHITGWKSSTYINKGYGIKNLISVSYDSESKNFMLYINNYLVTAFTVSEDIVFKNSKSGYVVVIANNETFPKNSVKVMFEK